MESHSWEKKLQWIREEIVQWWRMTRFGSVFAYERYLFQIAECWCWKMALKFNEYSKWDLRWFVNLNYDRRMILIWTLLWTKMNSWLILTCVSVALAVCVLALTPGFDLWASLHLQVSHAELFSPLFSSQMRCAKSSCKPSAAEATWKGKLPRPVQRCLRSRCVTVWEQMPNPYGPSENKSVAFWKWCLKGQERQLVA